MLAVVRVFTSDDSHVLSAHGEIIQKRYGLTTRTWCIPDQPRGIYDNASEEAAVPKIVAVAKEAAETGAQAVFISCAADPAVTECRRTLKIPVIGAGSAAAALGLALGKKIGVLNLNAPTLPVVAEILGNRLAMERWPQGVNDTTDLLTAAGLKAAETAVKEMTEKCDVILLGCTGYSTIHLADILRPCVKIPIVDAVEAGGAVAAFIMAGSMGNHG